jgi:hypothetical protein
VAARDAEILDAAEKLEADTGKRPTRRQLAEYVAATTDRSCSAGRASQAYRRQREAEAEVTGEPVQMDRAPGAGRKKAPLLDVVAELCERTLEATAALAKTPERSALPRALYGAARRLRQRRGWRRQLRQLTAEPAPPPSPEQLELQLDPLAATRQQIPLIQRAIESAEDDTARRQLWPVLRDYMQLLARLSPTPERDGRREVNIADLDGWLASARGKLEQAATALKADVRGKLEQCRQDGLMTPEAREVCRRLGHLPKESEHDDK